MNKTKIIGIVAVLVIVIALIWGFSKGGGRQEVSMFDPTDTVTTFYDQWLKAVKEPETAVPDLKTLAKWPVLSKTLRDKIAEAQKNSDTTTDPVLCQTVAPESYSTRRVYESAEEVQILVMSRDTSVTEQAIVTLMSLDGGWYINEIECSLGEVAPVREFTFEKEGFLLKDSLPAPYDTKKWHLVFEENGVPGHVAPLIFDSASECTNLAGDKASCKTDDFQEATKVSVQGQMTERGATVSFLSIVE